MRPSARAGDIKDVKNGFARNYLIPQKLAVLATRHEIERAEGLRHDAEARRKLEATEWSDALAAIKDEPIKIVVRTGPTGRLYGSVNAAMIATALAEITGREVDRRGIRVQSPIRVLGKFSVPARLIEGVETILEVLIEPDGDSIERIKQARKAAAEAGVEDPTFEEALSKSGEGEDAEGQSADKTAASSETSSAQSGKKKAG